MSLLAVVFEEVISFLDGLGNILFSNNNLKGMVVHDENRTL